VEDTFCGPIAEMPREGLLVTVDSMPTMAGGCAANVAIDLAKQGVEAEVMGCVGRDRSAKGLFECFKNHRIAHRRLVVSETLQTSRTVILLVKGEDRRYLHLCGANAGFSAADFRHDWLKSLDVLYLGGLFALPAMTSGELSKVFAFCRRQGVKTVLDVVIPQGTPPSVLREFEPLLGFTDYFLPNDDEATALTGYQGTRDQLARFLSLGVGTVIVTRGKNGAAAARGSDCWECGTYTMASVDPSGAGDAFASGVIASMLAGRDMPALLQYASAVGASATRSVGTTAGVMSGAEAEAFVASHPLIVEHSRLDAPSRFTGRVTADS
jgi:sugar/nucleoside kinase (ribokinase family)